MSKKKTNISVIEREGDGPLVYRIMDGLIGSHHPHLASVKIALAWHYGWKPDKDGHLRLGQARKASDLDRELHGFDFVLLLNGHTVQSSDWSEQQLAALIDHELCHCQTAVDEETGEQKETQDGRPVWRTAKHDIEEFRGVVQRHGLYKSDLEQFARDVAQAKVRTPLLDSAQSATAPLLAWQGDAADGLIYADSAMERNGGPMEWCIEQDEDEKSWTIAGTVVDLRGDYTSSFATLAEAQAWCESREAELRAAKN